MKYSGFLGILVAAACFLAAAGAYAAWHADVRKEAAEAAGFQAALRAEEAAGGRAAFERRAREALVGEEARIATYLVSPGEIVPFLESLEATGDRLGAEVAVVSVGDAPGAGASRIPLALSVTGSFDAVVRTLGALEYQPYDIRITSMTLDTTQAGEAPSGEWMAAAVFSVGMRAPDALPQAPPADGSVTSDTEGSVSEETDL